MTARESLSLHQSLSLIFFLLGLLFWRGQDHVTAGFCFVIAALDGIAVVLGYIELWLERKAKKLDEELQRRLSR